MEKKEFVQGDAYIASRSWKPTHCNWCGGTTTTTIRVPSLNMYLAWCESCQKVPYTSWYIPQNKKISNNSTTSFFDSIVNEYYFTGCNLRDANRIAIAEARKTKNEVSLEGLDTLESIREACASEDYGEYLYNIDYNAGPLFDSWIENISINNNHLLSHIIDLNYILDKVLCVVNDQEREILILIIHKYQLDNYLSDNIKVKLYKDFDLDASDTVKITQKGVAEFLGYHDNTAFRRYKKTIGTLIQKTKKILIASGFKKDVSYMENKVDQNSSCLGRTL